SVLRVACRCSSNSRLWRGLISARSISEAHLQSAPVSPYPEYATVTRTPMPADGCGSWGTRSCSTQSSLPYGGPTKQAAPARA
ncbi:MAG: hypothetical protein ACK55Z_31150, partial [bacterium]